MGILKITNFVISLLFQIPGEHLPVAQVILIFLSFTIFLFVFFSYVPVWKSVFYYFPYKYCYMDYALITRICINIIWWGFFLFFSCSGGVLSNLFCFPWEICRDYTARLWFIIPTLFLTHKARIILCLPAATDSRELHHQPMYFKIQRSDDVTDAQTVVIVTGGSFIV